MYIESLQTPHPRKVQEGEPQPLSEALQLPAATQEVELAASYGNTTYEAVKLAVVERIAHHVNKALWFPELDYGHDDYAVMGLDYPLTLDAITQHQAANCCGYTLVGSECLEKAGITHYIGFANGHAFSLVPSYHEGDEDLYLADMLSPQLNQFIGHALSRGNPPGVRTQVEHEGRAATMLDSQKLAATLRISVDMLANTHIWLKFGNESSTNRAISICRDEAHELSKYQAPYLLIMSIFGMEQGRQALKEYVAYNCSVTEGDTESACQSLQNMRGLYPELDARQSHEALRKLINQLCEQGDAALATQIVIDYFSANFRLSHDSRLPQARGDLLRRIAINTGFAPAAQEAERAYREAQEHPRAFHAALMGKRLAAHELSLKLAEEHSAPEQRLTPSRYWSTILPELPETATAKRLNLSPR